MEGLQNLRAIFRFLSKITLIKYNPKLTIFRGVCGQVSSGYYINNYLIYFDIFIFALVMWIYKDGGNIRICDFFFYYN